MSYDPHHSEAGGGDGFRHPKRPSQPSGEWA
jgi:hypothetical protein